MEDKKISKLKKSFFGNTNCAVNFIQYQITPENIIFGFVYAHEGHHHQY